MNALIRNSQRLAAVGLLALLVALSLPGTTLASAGVEVSERESLVKAGAWRTVATLWNTSAKGAFLGPAGTKIRVRYGSGWFSTTRQQQTLDGFNYKNLKVGLGSLVGARMQVKVTHDTWLLWLYIPG